MNQQGTNYLYTFDGNGNVKDVLDDQGASVASYSYSPFGKVVPSSGTFSDENRWQFSTKQIEPWWGLKYFGYRYLGDELWPSRDPVSETAIIRRYALANNAPTLDVDYLGLLTINQIGTPKTEPGCGYLEVMWDFVLDKPAPREGYLVQKVDLYINIKGCGWRKKGPNCPQSMTLGEPTETFWEAWPVKKGALRRKTHPGLGTFGETDMAKHAAAPGKGWDNKCGWYVAVGEVKFYWKVITGDIGDYFDGRGGWKQDDNYYSAALPYTKSEPDFWDAKPAEGPKVRAAVSFWKCCPCAKDNFNTVIWNP